MDILDSIGKDIISRLSSRYPDIKFYLIDVYQIKTHYILITIAHFITSLFV